MLRGWWCAPVAVWVRGARPGVQRGWCVRTCAVWVRGARPGVQRGWCVPGMVRATGGACSGDGACRGWCVQRVVPILHVEGAYNGFLATLARKSPKNAKNNTNVAPHRPHRNSNCNIGNPTCTAETSINVPRNANTKVPREPAPRTQERQHQGPQGTNTKAPRNQHQCPQEPAPTSPRNQHQGRDEGRDGDDIPSGRHSDWTDTKKDGSE